MTLSGLLAGIRVLDASIWRPGPYATQLLGDLGAEVCKIEPPGGDPMRAFPELFASLNGDKRSVVFDLKDDAHQSRARALADEADVLVEGFRPGVADRLGIGYDDVRATNPAIVYCSISGYGQTGPLRDVPGHDLNYQAYAGALAPDGGEPRESALPVGDLAGGAFAALAVCAAIVGRARTGEGERIDVSMTDVLATWTGAASNRLTGAEDRLAGLPTYGTFATADGRHLTLGVITEQHFWEAVCDGLGLDDLRDVGLFDRIDHAEVVRGRVAAAVAARPLDELLVALEGAPAAPALTRAEMLEHPQLVHRGLVGGTTAEGFPRMGYPVLFGVHPARTPGRAPGVGDHQDEGFRPRP
ncbi:MAG TPA: CaiB/BaiF CoA-transferase family protein [Acidimicrobiia bacterium]|nr:CaiB/BaiF CoA-transferase family protein [Acidimicrobiia bacterium]